MNSKDKASAFLREKILGMNSGAANTRLVRMILFDVVCKSNLNKCFVCHRRIRVMKNFTIEHKIPWQLNKSADLYWDMENIAFSHAACNKPYRGLNKPVDGKYQCKVCKEFKLPYSFNVDVSRKYKVGIRCKECLSLHRRFARLSKLGATV